MKKTTLLFLAITLSTLSQAQQSFNQEQLKAQEAVVHLFEALSNRDSVALKLHCTDDINLFEYGQVWNLDTLIHRAIILNTATDFSRTNAFDFISTEIHNNAAWVTYRLTSVITKNGEQTTLLWLETVVLEKQKKHWKVDHLHSTLIRKS